MKTKNVLFISHRAKHGGGERSFFELIIELSKNGKITPFIILGEKGWLYEKFMDAGFAPLIIEMPAIKRFNLKGALFILKIAQKKKINIIHSNTTRATVYSIFARMFSSDKLIWHNRGTDKRGLFEYFLSLFADKLIAISDTVQKQIIELGVNENKVIRVYNGLPINLFNEYIEKIPKQSDGLIRVALVGRFTAEKGHKYLIETANIIINRLKRTDFRFVFCGAEEFGDSIFDEVNELIKKYGLSEHFEFTGYIENIHNFLLKKIDITVLTSQREAFGRVILESWAACVPVISFDIEGPAELIENNKTGLLIEKNNTEILAAAILKLAADRMMYENLINYSTEKLKDYDIKNTADDILNKVYESNKSNE